MSSLPPLQSRGRSDNRADYQAAFLQRVHRLLQLAYESLKPADYHTAEEDDITGDLCDHMKHLTEIAPTEKWMGHFSIHDQDPSSGVTSAKTGLPRKGKRRPKIDIRIVCKQQVPNRGYCIEAKRLYRSDSVGKYLDDEGIGAFILGEYAKDDDHGGMIGYVQNGKMQDWLSKVETRLPKLPHHRTAEKTQSWERTNFAKGPRLCYRSSHTRNSGREFTVFHVFFAFGVTD